MNKQDKFSSNSNQEWMDVTQAAKYIQHSIQFMYNNIDEIPHYKPKGKLLFNRLELDKWIRGQWPLNVPRTITRPGV